MVRVLRKVRLSKEKMTDMEKYREITTITKKPEANRTTAALENAGIPVMIEHVEEKRDDIFIPGYRVLVPLEYSQSAARIISTAAKMGITSLN